MEGGGGLRMLASLFSLVKANLGEEAELRLIFLKTNRNFVPETEKAILGATASST